VRNTVPESWTPYNIVCGGICFCYHSSCAVSLLVIREDFLQIAGWEFGACTPSRSIDLSRLDYC